MHVAAVVDAAQEQSAGLQQINTAVSQMGQGTQKNAAMVEETTAASNTLASEVTLLNQLLSQFKLDQAKRPRPASIRPAQWTDTPAASPVRALGRRIASAFPGSAARDTSKDDWQGFEDNVTLPMHPMRLVGQGGGRASAALVTLLVF